jgi:hypothetical protein
MGYFSGWGVIQGCSRAADELFLRLFIAGDAIQKRRE